MLTAHRSRAVLIAVAAMALGACDREAPRQSVRLTVERASKEEEPEPLVVRVGIASVLSPAESLGHYRDLVDYLGERLGVRTEVVQRPNYAEMNELLRERYCLVAFVCNHAFVRAQREFGAELLAVPQVAGAVTYRAYIIVRNDSPFRSLEDLKGKRFAFADPLCNAGWLYPRFRILQLARSPFGYFGDESFTYSYEKSIRMVADRLADAAGVESPLYDSMVAKKDAAALATRIIDRSPFFGNPPVVVHPDIDPALRERVRSFLLTLHESERGLAILAGIRVDRFIEPAPDLYAPVDAMAQQVERR
jgi:phosphate/phosphite/phosphonate ABC transporter binding protein